MSPTITFWEYREKVGRVSISIIKALLKLDVKERAELGKWSRSVYPHDLHEAFKEWWEKGYNDDEFLYDVPGLTIGTGKGYIRIVFDRVNFMGWVGVARKWGETVRSASNIPFTLEISLCDQGVDV